MNTGDNAILRFLLFLPVLFICGTAKSQVVGTIIDSSSLEPVAGAYVSGYFSSRLVAQAFSDDDGAFILDSGSAIDTVRVSLLGYQSVCMPSWEQGVSFTVGLTRKLFSIPESKVKAEPLQVKGDTLSFYAKDFASGMEKDLGDLLEKLPGVSVTPSGGILHNGRYINKFYVEGLDLLGNKYGIVTKNLPPSDIARIEIYQYHQPVRVLQDIVPEERSAVNIILRENVKNARVWSADALIGGPAFPKYEGRAMLSRFSKKSQSLFLGKINNLGTDIRQELREQPYFGTTGAFLVSDDPDADLASRLSPTRNHISLPEEYWFDNISGVASFNHLFRTGKNGHVKLRFGASGQKYNEVLTSTEEVRLPGGDGMSISEERLSEDKAGYVFGSVDYQLNSSSLYLDNDLSFSGQYRNRCDEIGLDITQVFNLPSWKIRNNFNTSVKIGQRRTLSFASDSKYVVGNHILSVIESQDYLQEYKQKRFTSENKLSCSAGWLHLYASFNLDHLKVNDSFSASLFSPGIGLSCRHDFGLLQTACNLPLAINIITLSSDSKSIWEFSPDIQLKYPIMQNLEMSGRLNYNLRHSGIESLYPDQIRIDYRTVSLSDSLAFSRTLNSSLSIRYSNAPSLFFSSISLDYIRKSKDKMAYSKYEGQVLYSGFLPVPQSHESVFLNANAAKFFGRGAFRLEADASVGSVKSSMSLQGMAVNMSDLSAMVRMSASFRPFPWLAGDAVLTLSQDKFSGTFSYIVRSAEMRAGIKVSPVKALTIEPQCYYRADFCPDVDVTNIPLIKLALTWAFPKLDVTVECRNLIGAEEFRLETATCYQTFSTVTALRGRTFLAGIRMHL